MKGLTLRQLRYLDAVATHCHFGRAAEACSISQPALSNQIKELESLANAPLVERDSRNVHLTPLGAAFVDRARAILASVDELEGIVRASSDGLSGDLRLGIIPTVAPYLLPAIATALSGAFRELDLKPREAMTQTLVDDLLAYKLDAAILALPLTHSAFFEAPLFEEEFVLVRHHDERGKPMPSTANLANMRLLLLEEGHCLRDQALSFCALGTDRGRDILEGSSLSTLVQMVGAGIGLTLIPEIALPLETRISTVAIDTFETDKPKRTIGIVWRKKSPFAAHYDQLRAVIAEAAQNVLSDARKQGETQPKGGEVR